MCCNLKNQYTGLVINTAKSQKLESSGDWITVSAIENLSHPMWNNYLSTICTPWGKRIPLIWTLHLILYHNLPLYFCSSNWVWVDKYKLLKYCTPNPLPGGWGSNITKTGVLVVSLKVLKQPTAGPFAVPFRVLSWKQPTSLILMRC